MNPDAIYQSLGQLISTFPDFKSNNWDSPENSLWLGRAASLVEIVGGSTESINFKVCSNGLGSILHSQNVQTITAVLYRCLAKAELSASVTARESFIPVGEPFSALQAVSKVFGTAAKSVFIIDPYAEANLIIDFAVLSPDGIQIRIMSDESTYKSSLKPAATTWIQQYGLSRPLDVKLAPAKSLHDRIIIIDSQQAWTLGQSFNHLGTRSPTSLLRANAETAALKIAAYENLWTTAKPL